MKLALGTVQFGLDYGISNQEGKTPFKEVKKILHDAKLAGIEVLDTAASYGESEKILGEAMKNTGTFKIITKIPSFQSKSISDKDVQQIEMLIRDSLMKLQRDHIYGIIFHDVHDLFKENGEKLFYKLLELKCMGLMEKVGFSIYESDEIDRLIELFPFDMIQLPMNVLDQRLVTSGHMGKLKKKGIEIYARSIFLQGLLLMELEKVPQFFKPIFPLLIDYHQTLKKNEMTLLEGAIDFAKRWDEIDYLIVGINNATQLAEIKKVYKYGKRGKFDYSRFACTDTQYIDPRRWEKWTH